MDTTTKHDCEFQRYVLINFRAVNDFSTEALVARIIKIKATSSDASVSVSSSPLAKRYSLV
jgi:hypothetical protein